MRNLFFIAFCLIASLTNGQVAGSGSGNQAVSGEIVIPALQSVKVEMINTAPIKFETPDDINSQRIINGFCRITVISTVPWVVNVASGSDFLDAGNGANFRKVPAEMISIRNAAGSFIPLSTSPIPVLKSENDLIKNVFIIDLRISPSVKYEGGKYNANILFTITPD